MTLMRDISRRENEMTKERRPSNVVWFELPVSDLNRAKAFYESVFATKLSTDDRFPELAIFPRLHETASTGALAMVPDFDGASTEGTVVYLNCDGQLDAVLRRAQAAGANLVQEVAQLPGNMGWIALFRDLDGNRVGLHATF
jgi:uncharacterized protein